MIWVVLRPMAAVLFCALLGACATVPAPLSASQSTASKSLPAAPERYIVAAIDNDAVPPGGHAGSTPRGYDGLTAYGPSSHARRVMQRLASDYGLTEVAAWPIWPLHVHCAVLKLPDAADRDIVLAALARDRRIRLVEPLQNFATQTQEYDDPYVNLQRGFLELHVPDAHTWSQGSGVTIAIIDTGADSEHPDLRQAVEHTENFVDDDTRQFRRDRHGTEVAGVIAAVANNRQGIVGIAPASRLLLYKACWQIEEGVDAGRCNSFTLAKALAAALAAHAQVVNLSLAGPQDKLLRDLIAEGQRRGMVFVGAASPHFLQQSGVIEVASVGSPAVAGTLFAPGREILTLLPDGHYDFASGSSLANAHVTGTVALLLAKNPRLSSAAIYRLLEDSAVQHGSDLGATASIDACAAVVAVVGHGECHSTRPEPAPLRLAR